MSSPGHTPGGDRPQTSGGQPDSPTVWHPASEWPDDDEDGDDVDFQPESEHSGDIPELEDESIEDEEPDFDPELHLGNIQIEFEMDDANTDRQGEDAHDGRQTRVSAARLLNLLASNGLRRILRYNGWRDGSWEEDEDDEDDLGGYLRYRRRTANSGRDELPKVPSDEGTKLMGSGDFGSNPYFVDVLKKRKRSLATKLMWRELGVDVDNSQRRPVQSIAQGLIPESVADKIIHFDSRCYSGQFSDDGNFFFCCSQDFKVRMYDTSNPVDWKYYKTVDYPFGSWTITDATLSPDNRFLAYSSIRNMVCLAPTDPADRSEPSILDLSSVPGGRAGRRFGSSHFGIWSLRFSGDGREIVAGTDDDSVVVYDLETRQSVLHVQNHDDHVNAVCFGDKSSPHILYSGSDDTTLRVWDRRSMGDGREAGVFMGHTEGLTYVDSKGDGRYILSNGKDQSMKLWDLRKMMTTADFDKINVGHHATGFDYRTESYPDDYYVAHPNDCSVVTFRGHRVLRTLIRCHFSPPGSTDSRYVYTGSQDGKVYVYNMDATLAGTIDVGMATINTRPQDPDIFTMFGSRHDGLWRTCVRDASWHPNAPVLAATSWNGWGMSTGTCTVHSWNDSASSDEGDPPLGMSYDTRLRYHRGFNDFKINLDRRDAFLRSRENFGPTPTAGDFRTSTDPEVAWDMSYGP